MNDGSGRVLLGVLLVAAGILLLMQTLGVLAVGWGLLWGALFGLGGLAFLALLLSDRRQWWAIIPGFTFVGLGATIALHTLAPALPDRWTGSLFLASIGLAFAAIYLVRREFWWAIIPAGTLLTLALTAGVSDPRRGGESGSVFLFGLALTFALLSIVPTPRGRMTWPLIPAGVLFLLGLADATATRSSLASALWPVALIVLGGYLIYRAMARRA